MRRSGFLVRFVDVVLILLFGFISISEIQDQSEIQLPESSQSPPTPPDQIISVFIGVMYDGTYLVQNEAYSIRDSGMLRRYLAGVQNRYGVGNVRVRIRSDYDSPIMHVMQVARFCDELDIPKSIDVRLSSERT